MCSADDVIVAVSNSGLVKVWTIHDANEARLVSLALLVLHHTLIYWHKFAICTYLNCITVIINISCNQTSCDVCSCCQLCCQMTCLFYESQITYLLICILLCVYFLITSIHQYTWLLVYFREFDYVVMSLTTKLFGLFPRSILGSAADIRGRVEANSLPECSNVALLHLQSANRVDRVFQILAGCFFSVGFRLWFRCSKHSSRPMSRPLGISTSSPSSLLWFSTIDDRAFLAAASGLWNTLPQNFTLTPLGNVWRLISDTVPSPISCSPCAL